MENIMSANSNLPPNIESFVSTINMLEKKSRLNTAEKKKICMCKLKIAIWACRSEGMELSRYALSQILGPDTSEVFSKTEQAMAEINWDTKEDKLINKQIIKKYSNNSKSRKSGGNIELFK